MPYELLAKGGLTFGILVILAFTINQWSKNNDRMYQDNQNFINKVIDEHKEEKKLLMVQLDRYNNSLQENTACLKEVSDNIKAIPRMQEDIRYLKEKIQ